MLYFFVPRWHETPCITGIHWWTSHHQFNFFHCPLIFSTVSCCLPLPLLSVLLEQLNVPALLLPWCQGRCLHATTASSVLFLNAISSAKVGKTTWQKTFIGTLCCNTKGLQGVYLPAAYKVSWTACLYSQKVMGANHNSILMFIPLIVQSIMQTNDCVFTNYWSSGATPSLPPLPTRVDLLLGQSTFQNTGYNKGLAVKVF
jgi:hypothetical protein